MNILGLALIAFASPSIANEPVKVVKTVTVDAQRFKVVWKGDQATVERKGMFFKADAHMHLAAIKAAEQVSGCKATANFTPSIGVVVVALECPQKAAQAL